MIDRASIEQLKNIVDIADVVGSYIPLKKSGGNFVCLCPFHEDKHPSMSVSPSRGLFHCFSCKAGGDSIKFIMDYEKISYPEAVEKLASMYNFTLKYTEDTNIYKYDKRVLEVLNLHYKSLLYKNKYALNYLYKRGINDEIIHKFEIGWADSNQNTLNLLQNEQIELRDALEVGAIKQNQDGYYASFINRITFPIYSHLGKLVGFGGRTISNNPAKYVNSPESAIFSKSRLFYGYEKAKDEIYKKNEIIICEGYMDCIMMHKAGITNAVAVLGVALTEKHIPLLKRGDIKVILCFDSDNAGLDAAFKSARLLCINEIDGQAVLIKGEKDPADMVANGKANELKTMLQGGVELGEFYIKTLLRNLNPQSPTQKQKALEAVQEFTFNLKQIVANSYVNLVASTLNINTSLIKLSKFYSTKTHSIAIKNPKKDILELSLLKHMISNKNFLEIVKKECDDDVFCFHKEAYMAVINSANDDNTYIREINFTENLESYSDETEFRQALNLLKIRRFENEIKVMAGSNRADKYEKIEQLRKYLEYLKVNHV